MFITYTIRNLIARRTTVIPTMLAVVITVAAIMVMQSLVAGLTATIGESGRPNNAVVLSQGADSDSTSGIVQPMIAKVEVLPEIERVAGVAQVSPEFVIGYKFKAPDGRIRTVNVRGVDPIALQVHQGVKLLEGGLPENHAFGCVIGAQQVGKLAGFKAGGTIRIGSRDWPVTGILSAPSTQFESELWCDRTALLNESKRSAISVIYVRLTSAAAVDPFVKGVRAIAGQPLDAFSEPAHFGRSFKSASIYIRAVTISSLILAIGAILACTNAVYLAFLGRIRELATLVAIGYTRWRVAMIALQESLFMTLVSGVIGIGLALLIDGRSFGMEEISVIYQARVSPTVLLAGVAVTVAIGVLGALASVIHALRLQVLFGLRAH